MFESPWIHVKYIYSRLAESWVKHHVFSLPTALYPHCTLTISPHGFTLKNQFVFKSYDDRLTLYDPVADKVKSFEIVVRVPMDSRTKTVQYIDSLVWVTLSEHVIDVAPSTSSLQIWKNAIVGKWMVEKIYLFS